MQTSAKSEEILDPEYGKPDKERRGKGSRREKLTNIVTDKNENQKEKDAEVNN